MVNENGNPPSNQSASVRLPAQHDVGAGIPNESVDSVTSNATVLQPDDVAVERVEATGSQTGPAQAVDERFPGAPSDEPSAGATVPATNANRPLAPPPASETSTPALDAAWRCKCGQPSTKWPGEYCDWHHVILGTPGPAVTTGLDAEHLPEDDDIPPGGYTDRLTDLLSRHVWRLSAHLDKHTLRLADVPLVEKLSDLIEKVKAIKAQEQPAGADDSVTDAPYDAITFSRKLALFYANEPDAFSAFIVTLVEADREKCGPLRQQLRLTLDALEPEGKPIWRADPNEADEVVL